MLEAREGTSSEISVSNKITVVKYKSKKVLTALAEASGLLVILKVLSLFFSYIHEYLFDREMREKEEEGERCYKEVFTYTNFKKALSDIEIMKESINNLTATCQEQREQILALNYQ